MPDEPTANQGMFYCRNGTGLCLTGLTLLFLGIADVAIAVIYKNILDDSEASCSLKAAYGMFIVATGGQTVMFIMDGMLLYATARTGTSCRCVCYHFKVIVHFSSCTMIFMGSIIYGTKDPDKVGWAFYLALVSGFICLINALMWLLTQHTKRYLMRAGVDVKNLEDGKRHSGGTLNAYPM